MTIIDQSILIPTSPDVVWEIISDIDKNVRWQADYESVSFLTSLRSGSGVRWRYASPNGTDFVVETTAWYDGIGYEYMFIDGVPFRESQGRLRLQEIAEGTIVKWSLEYEMGGVLAGMRNSLSVRRHHEKTMVSSLRGLWTFVKETGGTRQDHEAKSLMRDAPDYEERAQYSSRHPTTVHADDRESPVIEEPPIADDDTRPNPTVAVADADQSARDQGWVEMEPVQIDTGSATETDENEQIQADDLRRFQPPRVETENDDLEILVQPDPETKITAPTNTDDLEVTTVLPEITEDAQTEPGDDEFGPKLDTSKLDTSEVSIWEVFGVMSPSETQRTRTIKVDEQGIPLEDQTEGESDDIKPVKIETADEESPATTDSATEPEQDEPDFQIAPDPVADAGVVEKADAPVTPEPVAPVTINEADEVALSTPKIEPPTETESMTDERLAAAAATQEPTTLQNLPPVTGPLIAGYRINLRRQSVKIRRRR